MIEETQSRSTMPKLRCRIVILGSALLGAQFAVLFIIMLGYVRSNWCTAHS
jgi:hypothetical protein